MKCNYCGKELSDSARFCNSCGAAVQQNNTVNLKKPEDNIDRSINNPINMNNNFNTNSVNNTAVSESPKYVDFGEAISLFFRNYLNFSGRSTRSEYWYTVLFMFLVGLVLGLMGEKMQFISRLFTLATFIPSLAICFRRFHDAGKNVTPLIIMYAAYLIDIVLAFATFGSALVAGFGGSRSAVGAAGGMILLLFVAGIVTLGIAIYNIVILCQPSVPTENQYGRPPMK